ncbi:MAG: DUF1622 domain-containing protein [Planctomycetes bacterium]|nr:DUF1622 domain-containing protein [Planctomycetota bacterium]
MLRLGVETLGALVIFAGVIVMLQRTVEGLRNPTPDLHERLRLTLARFMAVALEIQLGGDILTTAIAPTWDQIGKLGAIAVIRTVLNHFLSKEMQEAEHLGLGRPAHHGPAAHAPPPAPPAPPAPQAHPA